MMLNLMPIPHVFQMNDIIPMSRTTNNSGRHLLTTGADVRDSQARSNDIGGMFARRATFLLTIRTSAPDLPSHGEAPQADHVALHTFPTKHVA